MSSQNESAADLISAYASVKTDIFVDFAAMAFFVYDYAVTFGSEVNLVWKRRPSVASALVLSIRYLYLIASILSITGDALHSGERLCRAVEVTGSIAWYTVYFPVALFTGMRAYGLCGSWIIFSLVTVLSLAPMISDYVDLATRQTTVINIFGCGIEDSDTLQDAIM
ncbi:hypothetical protein C8Q80DRAFT_1123706 [Daedaleopsis nitida]|nr:hypothetical protein C8Q80DRAFT_1123706 [Daedaleopsis nitida]